MRTRWHVSCYISLQCFTVSPFFHIVQQGKNRKHRKRTKGHKRWKLRSGKEIKRDETTTEYWFPKQVTQEVGDVKHLVTHNDPAVLVGVVLGNLLCTDWHADSSWLWKIRSPKSSYKLVEPRWSKWVRNCWFWRHTCFTLGTATQNISESTGRHLQGTHGTLRVLCQWTQYSLMFLTGLCDVHNFRTPSTACTNPCRTRYMSVTNKYSYCENTIV